MTSQFETQVKS